MSRHLRFLLACGLASAGLLSVAGDAAAGGWAVTTLDAAPKIEAGEPAAIGFTIRQHGVSPVDLEGVALIVIDAAGTRSRFDAVAEGALGHYVAVVELPTIGDHTWKVEQGGFGVQELGSLMVSEAASGASSSERRFDAPTRWALPVVAALFGLLAIGDAARARRRVRPAAV